LAERRKFRLGVIFHAGSRQMSDFADNLANGVDDQPRLIEIDIVPAVRLGDMRGMEGTETADVQRFCHQINTRGFSVQTAMRSHRCPV
jgi:hypothetical protein